MSWKYLLECLWQHTNDFKTESCLSPGMGKRKCQQGRGGSRKTWSREAPSRSWQGRRVGTRSWVGLAWTRVRTTRVRPDQMLTRWDAWSGVARGTFIAIIRSRKGWWLCRRTVLLHGFVPELGRNPSPVRWTSEIGEDHHGSRRGEGLIGGHEVLLNRRSAARLCPRRAWSRRLVGDLEFESP